MAGEHRPRLFRRLEREPRRVARDEGKGVPLPRPKQHAISNRANTLYQPGVVLGGVGPLEFSRMIPVRDGLNVPEMGMADRTTIRCIRSTVKRLSREAKPLLVWTNNSLTLLVGPMVLRVTLEPRYDVFGKNEGHFAHLLQVGHRYVSR